jgi:formate C-acetyltransferase
MPQEAAMPATHHNPEDGFPRAEWETTRPTDRVARIRERLLTEARRIDLERACITTESYRHTEGAPMPIRRAVMLHDLARATSIAIYDGERIVGNRSLLPRMGIIAPEGAVDWIDRELEILPTRPQDRFNITTEEIDTLRRDVFPYWRGATLEDAVAARVPEHIRRAVKARAFSLNQTDHAQGHILPDVEDWLRLGIGGLRLQVLAGARGAVAQPDRGVFYAAAEIALEAAALFARRYARLAVRLARNESDLDRQRELREIAVRCLRLAEHPPRNVPEALQSVWFLFVLLQMESNASSFSPGRLDQYLLPYLEHDLERDALTLDEAQEWLELLWLKFNEIVLLRSSASARYFAGFPIGFNVILGGQKRDGADATNLLSYMCLRAQADVGLTQPNLSIRIHRDSPQQFLRAASSVIGRGGGMPQVFNDEVIIPGQIARGVDPDDARDYAVVGCVELSVPGKALGWSDASMFNMTRVLELTLFGGCDPQTGEQIGPATPPLDQTRDFAALEAAYDAQLMHFVALMTEGCAIVDRIHAELLPSPFLSLVVKDCLARGVDVTAGGARYNFSGVQGVQVANVADSLAAVKQAVFDEGWLTGAQLLKALRCDFDGLEPLRQRLINRAPKFGNDDDRADAFAARWADRYSELVASYPTVRGGVYQPGFYTVSAHVPMGAHVGATPDGRRAGEPLADGGLSPASGRDRRGPTAVLRSVGKIDLSLASNGALLNMKFLPSFFRGDDALDSFVDLLRGFSALRIPHVQFNVVSAETLRQAQARPEEYRGLVVRVAGYSAYFTELDRALQDEIIARTEFDEA